MKLYQMIGFVLLVSICTSACSGGITKNVPNSAVKREETSVSSSTPMDTLPQFSMVNTEGNEVTLHSFKGKKILVNLWASWCPPCRQEMPSIQKLIRSVDTATVAFVLISLDDHFEKAKKFIKNQRLHLPIYYPASQLPALFNVQGIPATFIFNEKGELIKQVDGADDYDVDAYRMLLK